MKAHADNCAFQPCDRNAVFKEEMQFVVEVLLTLIGSVDQVNSQFKAV